MGYKERKKVVSYQQKQHLENQKKCNPKFFYYDEAFDKKSIALESKNKSFTKSIRNHSSTMFTMPNLESKNLRLKEKNKHFLTSTLIQKYPIIDHFIYVQMKNLYSRILTIKLKVRISSIEIKIFNLYL